MSEIVAAASSSPTSIEPESPMKIRAGLKLCGRKPTQAPTSTAVISVGASATSVVVDHGQVVAVGEEGQRRDADDAGRQPVQAVDEVDRVDRSARSAGWSARRQRPGQPAGAVSPRRPAAVQQLDARTSAITAGRGDLAGELGQRSPARSGRRARRAGRRSGRRSARPSISLPSPKVRCRKGSRLATSIAAHEPGQHRHAAQPRDRHRVHVPVARAAIAPQPDGAPAAPPGCTGR